MAQTLLYDAANDVVVVSRAQTGPNGQVQAQAQAVTRDQATINLAQSQAIAALFPAQAQQAS